MILTFGKDCFKPCNSQGFLLFWPGQGKFGSLAD